jgi:hypothetical protein
MKLPLILPTFLLILAILHPALTYADTQSPAPDATSPAQGAGSGVGTGEGRVHVIPAMQLPLNATPPIACSADTRGTIALNAAVQLCLCDGAGWKLVNTDTSCTWKTTP